MALEDRYELLLTSGQASKTTIEATRFALALVEEHYGTLLDEETGGPLASHLAITLKRLKDGEVLSQVPQAVWDELQAYPEALEFASYVVTRLEELLNTSIPQSEVGFLAVHLARIYVSS